MDDTYRLINAAIAEFNKMRSPEATAELVSRGAAAFTVRFTGSFCRSCGMRDYFDDFVIMLSDFRVHARIGKITERDDGAVVEFDLGRTDIDD